MSPTGALIATQAISSAAQIGSGFSANRAAKEESKLVNQQAQLALEESRLAAAQKAREVTSFQSEQAMRYAKSGVTLEGSPVLVLAETRRLGQEEVAAIERRGRAQALLLRQRAEQTRKAGRSAMLGGIFNAASGAAGTYMFGKKIGMFGNTVKPSYSTSYYTGMDNIPFDPGGIRGLY